MSLAISLKDSFHRIARLFAPEIVYERPLAYSVVEEFHKLFYVKAQKEIEWKGNKIRKSPIDLVIYAELLQKVKPDLIIECGTYLGGSARYFSDMLEGKVRVISIDIRDNVKNEFKRENITYRVGSSISDEVVQWLFKIASHYAKIFVVLDSDHSKNHVLKELEIYSSLVGANSYIVVEDTNVNGKPVYLKHGPGPDEAVEEFMNQMGGCDNFVEDGDLKRRYLFSYNTWLKKM